MHGTAHKPRTHPRVELDLPIELDIGLEQPLFIRVLDLSLAGMQWACDGLAAARILPRNSPSRPSTPPELEVRLALPGARGLDVRARCRPVFLRRVAENDYRVGLCFIEFHGDSRAVLESYIQICIHTRR